MLGDSMALHVLNKIAVWIMRHIVVPLLWNKLQLETKSSGSINCFKHNMKSYYSTKVAHTGVNVFLKLVSVIFHFFCQMIAIKLVWKMLFISSWDIFVLETSTFLYFCLAFFFPVGQCFVGWLKIDLKVYEIISYLNKNLIIHFDW